MSSRARKLDRFAELKAARQGLARSKQYRETETGDDGKIYDELDEDQYKAVVKGRLQRDDFIEDDDGGGYADNGMDDWERGENSEEEEDLEEYARRRKDKKLKKKDKKEKKPRPEVESTPDISAYRPVVNEAKESDFMASLLQSMDAAPATTSRPRPAKRKSGAHTAPMNFTTHRRSQPVMASSSDPVDPYSDVPSLSSGMRNRRGAHPSSDSAVDTWTNDFTTELENFGSPAKKARFESTAVTSKLNDLTMPDDDSFYDNFYNDDMPLDDMSAIVKKEEQESRLPPLKPVDNLPRPAKKESAFPSWLSVQDTLNVKAESDDTIGSAAIGNSAVSKVSALEEDGSLRFFWLDYLENDGKVYLVGKVMDKPTGKWVSCCVTVENIERNLFVLKRDRKVEDGAETDEMPSNAEVFQDFDHVRRKAGIQKWSAKFVKRRYAFGEADVPTEETEWMKVVYGFDEPQLPTDISGPSFSRVFGTNTSAFELLVLKRKIMGPCWLQVKEPTISHTGVSWCKLEVVVSNPKEINPETDSSAPKDIPPLTMMSVSLRTIVNHKENKREIVCATLRTWENVNIDDPTPPEQLSSSVHTIVRPLDRFPAGFENKARSEKSKIITMKNERMLLGNLLATIHRYDPDILVGHDFLGVSLDILLHRLRELKTEHFSRIGRFRRAKWPNISRQGMNLKFLNGRLLCDLASDGAKSMITSTTWSLTEMCQGQLKIQREDIDPDDTASYMDSTVNTPDRLLHFVRHCEMDTFFQMAIAARVQILPLTRQLTALAGNSWNKTLNGGRAERNEYILLHEFHRLKYIVPDKMWGKRAANAAAKAEAEEIEGGAPAPTKKKDKYKGGLVFEPKRGLWDKYILVMDFNSLYPSIIQEYNIDFTTIDQAEQEEGEEEKMPEVPASDIAQGVLPRLIATLVNRRRQVKALMKDKSASKAKLLQYDIRQKALKLTANSMYGCLGFEYSRFYARPLAALTTFKGREILTHTRELAESLQLDVVYGDTDSVFVNSNVSDLDEAKKIANEFKKHVNDRYKLLEIDLDGIFQRLLLLQKKKYAALKVEEDGTTSTEVKGLDMKRREYCALSKMVSQAILEFVLSGEPTEVVVEHIHEYLTKIGEDVRSGKIDMDEFIIFKRLGKNPEDYPDAKSQPHVQVALRMKARGNSARGGDVIPYIFCLGEDGQTARTAHADRAHHPDELRKVNSGLQIDYVHYLSQQILPPIERLCEPIEGTDRARLAECLGLDPGRYSTSLSNPADEPLFGTLDSQIPDKERFKDVDSLLIRCRKCEASFMFGSMTEKNDCILHVDGPKCPACYSSINSASLQVQLDRAIRDHIAKYYEGWMVCDDPTCGNRTRSMGVYGRRCMRPGCHGSMAFEYTDLMLYHQILFYGSLLDGKKAEVKCKNSPRLGTSIHEVKALLTTNHALLGDLAGIVNKHLEKCGRQWVDLGGLFSYMKV
ncbi:DNA polymerase alpha catalytic subunit, partial [Calocera viscosa TUFC12733]